VYVAGLHRATRQTITTGAWAWIGQEMGQFLFDPPNVAGWDYTRWLDTARWAGRFTAVNYALQGRSLDPDHTAYPKDENPAQALAGATRFWGDPPLSPQTADWEQVPYRVLRQNALRALIPTTPDFQTC
jgi:hypothetical protein